jgi:poly-gamma-glutamate capsule biosynthesis protein CapA/YwtB (metallophosphatase superfamily)
MTQPASERVTGSEASRPGVVLPGGSGSGRPFAAMSRVPTASAVRRQAACVFLIVLSAVGAESCRRGSEPPVPPRPADGAPAAAPARLDTVTLAAAGDVMLAGAALPVVRRFGPDFPFDSTRSVLKSADFAIANLEAPFGAGGRPFQKTFTFRVPPEFAAGLPGAGFDVLNLANNHILDFGRPPFEQTLRILDSLGIGRCGAGMNRESAEAGTVVERGGWRAAFLGFSLTYPDAFWATASRPGTAFAVRERIAARIDSLRRAADLVIVSFHWGKELHGLPEPYQREFAHAAIDAGADCVIGHHPHVLQGFELYRGKPIAYSLGNFAFGSESVSCRESALFVARFDSAGFTGGRVIPLCVDYRKVRFQPRPLRGAAADRLIDELNRLSERLNGGRKPLLPGGVLPAAPPR